MHNLLRRLHERAPLLPLVGLDEGEQLLVRLLDVLLLKVRLDRRQFGGDALEHPFAVGLVEPAREFLVLSVVEQRVRLDGRELATQTQRTLHRNGIVAEVVAAEHLALHGAVVRRLLIGKRHVALHNLLGVLRRDGAVAVALVLAQFLKRLTGVDELHEAPSSVGFLVGEHPHIGGDARVVEDIVWELDDAVHEVVLDEVAADVALALSGVAREEARAVVNRSDARPLRLVLKRFHLVHLLEDEEQLSVARARRAVHRLHLAPEVDERQFIARVGECAVVVDLLLVRLPRLAVGRIGDAIAERLAPEVVLGDGVAEVHALRVNALDDKVGFADGIRLGVDLRAVELYGRLLHTQLKQIVAPLGEHAARTLGRVVKHDGLGEVVLHRLKNQPGKQGNSVARREVRTRLLVVLLVEASEQFLEDSAHGDVGERRQGQSVGVGGRAVGEVDVRVGHLLDDG